MKKMILALLIIFLLAIPVNAVTLENTNAHFLPYGIYTENINNDPAKQAQMLKKLGLFAETNQGFDLDTSITRCEAAVMLVRFLGEEKKVLAGSWKHPFTDVPKWAGKYVGWLYQNGITKGVGAKKYGSAQYVTYKQFATFLNRACIGNDDYLSSGIGKKEEQELSELNRIFFRGSAVGLMTRVLGCGYYEKNNNFITMARLFVQKKVFTPEALGEASWGVLPSIYGEMSDNELCRVIVDVPVTKCSEKGLYVSENSIKSNLDYFYASRVTEDNKIELFQIDVKTMEAHRVSSYDNTGAKGLDYVGSSGGRDYLMERRTEKDGSLRCGALMSYEGRKLTAAISALDLWGEHVPYVYEHGLISTENALAVIGGTHLFVISENGVHGYEIAKGSKMLYFDGKSIVAQLVAESETIISCIDAASGLILDNYKVQQDLANFPRTISDKGYGRFYGEAGLYRIDTQQGRLRQITSRPVADVTGYRNDFRPIILTHEPGKRVWGMNGYGGDEIILIENDGTEKVLLENKSEHSLDIAGFTPGSGSTVSFFTAQDQGMQHFNIFNYDLLPDGSIFVTDFTLGRPETVLDPDNYKISRIKEEQARLDALGY